MAWDGDERRKNLGYCDQHLKWIGDFSEIKTSIKNIEKNLNEGMTFRNAIVVSLISMTLVIVIQIATFSYLWGSMTNQVRINTSRLDVIENAQRQK